MKISNQFILFASLLAASAVMFIQAASTEEEHFDDEWSLVNGNDDAETMMKVPLWRGRKNFTLVLRKAPFSLLTGAAADGVHVASLALKLILRGSVVALVNNLPDPVNVTCNSSSNVIGPVNLQTEDSMAFGFRRDWNWRKTSYQCTVSISDSITEFPVWGNGVPKRRFTLFKLQDDGVSYRGDFNDIQGVKVREW